MPEIEEEKQPTLFQRYGILVFTVAVFSIVSWLATAGGVRIVVPTIENEFVTWAIALAASAVVQVTIIRMIKGIFDDGLWSRWLFFYVIFASVSILGSYVYLFERWSGGIINVERRQEFSEALDDYVISNQAICRQAAGILSEAVNQLAVFIQIEEDSGGSGDLARSPFLQEMEARRGIDYSDAIIAGECGKVCKQLKAMRKEFSFELETLESYLRKFDAFDINLVSTQTLEERARGIRSVIEVFDWRLIEDVIVSAGRRFEKPEHPILEELGLESGSDVIDKVAWARDAVLLIRDGGEGYLVPLIFAIGLDVTNLLLAVILPYGVNRDPNLRRNLLVALRAAPMSDAQVMLGVKRVLGALSARNKKNPQNFHLDLQNNSLGKEANTLLGVLEQQRLIRPRRALWGPEYIVSSAVHAELADLILHREAGGKT